VVDSESTPFQWSSISSSSPQLIISSDASLQGWGITAKATKQADNGLPQKGLPYKHSRAESSEVCNYVFSSNVSKCSVHPHSNGQHCRSDFLLKMGETKNEILTKVSKQIWGYLLEHQITITAEYLPGILTVEADAMSLNVKDSSEWKLDHQVFWDLCRARLTPCTDLFASRLSHLLEDRSIQQGSGCSSSTLDSHLRVCFSTFLLNKQVLWKVQVDQATILLIAPAWQSQAWCPRLLQLSIQNPILLPLFPDLLLNSQGGGEGTR